jgi:alanine-synthesizing transaminase
VVGKRAVGVHQTASHTAARPAAACELATDHCHNAVLVFSDRTSLDFTPNPLSTAIAELRRRGRRLTDLTLSNPTVAGFHYPVDLLAPLAREAALIYEPSPLGHIGARTAVAAEYARRDMAVDPSHVALTASTSEGYSLLFKLLCNPGDEVLVPVPSYPLFEHLTKLDAVRPVSYPLEYHGRWRIDLHALATALTPRTRAVLLVSPNNPTGSCATQEEIERVSALCARHGCALISDEVFADYPFAPDRVFPSVVANDSVLSFALGGLSKSAGLPQVKLGWIAISGPEARVRECMPRLEYICDTYLSVSTPVQHAAAALAAAGRDIRVQIAGRVRANRRTLASLVADAPSIELLDADGGWSAVIRVPAIRSEEQLALELLQRDHVIVHPGYFFDFATEAFIVISLLPREDEFLEGARRVVSRASDAR